MARPLASLRMHGVAEVTVATVRHLAETAPVGLLASAFPGGRHAFRRTRAHGLEL